MWPSHNHYELPLSECRGLGGSRGLGEGAREGTRDGTRDGGREGYGDPYGASWYRCVSSMSEKRPTSPLAFGFVASALLSPSALAIPRGLPNGDDFFRVNCPRIGASEFRGVPGNGIGFLPLCPVNTIASGSFPAGWLYIHVATKTVDEPIMNDGVMRKSNSATDARKDRMMERLVANPFRMLSEYLMTTAVMSPPKTWIATVAHAHRPKLRKRSRKKPCELSGVEE